MDDEEFNDILRGIISELAGRYYGVDLPDASTDPAMRVTLAIGTALLEALPGGCGASVLRHLGELAVSDDGG